MYYCANVGIWMLKHLLKWAVYAQLKPSDLWTYLQADDSNREKKKKKKGYCEHSDFVSHGSFRVNLQPFFAFFQTVMSVYSCLF